MPFPVIGPHRRTARQRAGLGFTAIELIVIIAMIGVTAALIAPISRGDLSGEDLTAATTRVLESMREAQANAMTGRGNTAWGVRFSAEAVTVFGGQVFNPADPANRTWPLDGQAGITAVNLSPGGACTVATGVGNCAVLFADAAGRPAVTGSVEITNSAGETATVTINAEGLSDSL
jgi:type II secretory pathway pseudopilin PulG